LLSARRTFRIALLATPTFNLRDNFETRDDPGFVDAAKGDFRLRDDSIVYKKIPGFEKIPFEKIGLERAAGAVGSRP